MLVLPYPHQKGGHCGSGALRDLMTWAGLGWGGQLSEGLVFTLGGALDFAYLRVDALNPPIYLVGRGADLEVDLLRRLGAKVELRQTDDPVLGWKWVTTELDSGRPVMVWADIAELPYLRVRLRMSRHDIVIVGYDDETRVAYVVDNDRDEIQTVPYDALARARSSTGFPTPTRHATYMVEWPSAAPDLPSMAAAALEQSAATLRHGGPSAIAAPPANGVSGTGLDGVRCFADDVTRWPDIFGDADLEAVLRALAAFIEKAGTGGGLFRRLLAQGCVDLADHTRNPHVDAAASAARLAAQSWTRLAQIATSDETPSLRSVRVAQEAALLPELEEALANLLTIAASSL
ncbi:BtrH N-terminal domain-containing protein [Nocardia puris]|uniref:BtrH N-terminal domain-containing protein n=1 Tax=Nocardia TaxID=1817 RepID=UPI0004A6AD8B|nr:MULTISPECIES: BtrH N-terminal domain-containing protein [Nocardia]MBF6137169.1 BtrH N-terminal domain-containing protein [Nocardia otitidiscaviarum]MBF6181773.1 BtrH N-terminal domain-containing protein [Nocardia otitidiscaviarum]MBF6370387.1 BtrH N-terminal domain-containing protein [Nocardia puris]MBF6461666.1 BtrH N-terminal domain-containing protein [Nocardia puris]MBF6488068.1 BtrH N-terminal domain-containing protein [Nocardia otitidiscaviarum]